MKIELSPLIIALLAIIPSFFVFLAMTLRQRKLEEEVKKLANDALVNNSLILELEKEIVTAQTGSGNTLRKAPNLQRYYDFETRKAVF